MAKEPQPKRNVYVGGLEEQVNEEILHAAFVPFGDIVEVRQNDIRNPAYRYVACAMQSQVYLQGRGSPKGIAVALVQPEGSSRSRDAVTATSCQGYSCDTLHFS